MHAATNDVGAWLKEGEAMLGRCDLAYGWCWSRLAMRGMIAAAVCYAPAPDGSPYYCMVRIHPDRFDTVSRSEQRITVLHELAHVVDFADHRGGAGDLHGTTWGALMARMGLPTTNYPTVARCNDGHNRSN